MTDKLLEKMENFKELTSIGFSGKNYQKNSYSVFF